MTKTLKIFLTVLTFFIVIAMVSFLYYENRVYTHLIENYNSKFLSEFKISYNGIYKSFKNTSDLIFNTHINKPENLHILYESIYLGKDVNENRKLLADKLAPLYEKIKMNGFSLIHFIDKDGRSFLRMHQTDKFGDSLGEIRPLVNEIIRTQKPVSGYEIGRYYDGFRYLYPLFYNDTFIGIADITVTPLAYVTFLPKGEKDRFAILYHKDSLENISKEILDDLFLKLPGENDLYLKYDIPDYKLDKMFSEALNKNIDKMHLKYSDMVVNLKELNYEYSLIFLNIENFDGKHIGRIVKFVKTPELKVIKREFYLNIFSTMLIIAIIIIFSIFLLLVNKRLEKELSKRRKSEKELLDTNKKYETVIKNSGQIVYDLNLETGEIERFGAIKETLGYEFEELKVGRFEDYKSLFHIDDLKKVSDFIEKIAKDETGGEIVYRMKRKDGTYATIIDTATLVLFSGEKHLFGVMKDITRQIENERKLNKMKQYENIGLLAGGIAHDFNNILSSFYNYLEILKLKCHDEEICQMIDKIFINLNRGKALAAQLLTFAKGGKPSTKPFDTVKCVKSVAEFVLSGTDIVLDFVSKGEIKSCLGDEDQISQAIENILMNARQAISKDGKIDVTISNMTNNEAKAYFKNENLKHENYILITVTDNGKGMDEETAKNVFDPFFTTREDGYGLGLTSAHNIIKKHEGDISLESKIGEGTKVSIILPATEQKCENYIQEEKRDVINDKLNILIMDDEEDILYSLSELLKILGYNPLMAKNGEEAIKIYKDFLLKGEKIDLCILDITIRGGMGGKETIKRLKEVDENVKAVVSSGYSEDPIISMPQEYGFVASLQKPFKIDELVKLLREIL